MPASRKELNCTDNTTSGKYVFIMSSRALMCKQKKRKLNSNSRHTSSYILAIFRQCDENSKILLLLLLLYLVGFY